MMCRQSKKVVRFSVLNIRHGSATAIPRIAVRSSPTGCSKIEQLLPRTDQFPPRHIGLNSEAEHEMTNVLGLQVNQNVDGIRIREVDH